MIARWFSAGGRVRVAALAVLVMAGGACDKMPLTAPTESTIQTLPPAPTVPLNGSVDVVATVIEAVRHARAERHARYVHGDAGPCRAVGDPHGERQGHREVRRRDAVRDGDGHGALGRRDGPIDGPGLRRGPAGRQRQHQGRWRRGEDGHAPGGPGHGARHGRHGHAHGTVRRRKRRRAERRPRGLLGLRRTSAIVQRQSRTPAARRRTTLTTPGAATVTATAGAVTSETVDDSRGRAPDDSR